MSRRKSLRQKRMKSRWIEQRYPFYTPTKHASKEEVIVSNLTSLFQQQIRDIQISNAVEDASSPPAPGFVGELARVVADEVVPKAAVRLHEPLAGVDDAMIRSPPLLLSGTFRQRGVATQPQLLLELAFQSIAPAVVSNAEHLLHGHEARSWIGSLLTAEVQDVAGEDSSRSCIGVVMEKRIIVSYVADPFCHHEYVVMHDASIIKVRRAACVTQCCRPACAELIIAFIALEAKQDRSGVSGCPTRYYILVDNSSMHSTYAASILDAIWANFRVLGSI